MTTEPKRVDVLEVLRTSGRAVALYADTCVKGLRGKQWLAHLKKHDEACAAVADLIEAVTAYAEAEEALANREYMGINGEPYEKLQARLHATRRDLYSALSRIGGTP